MLVYRDRPYLFLVSRILGEPQRHSTSLALGDSSDTVGVFLPRSKPDHAATLWTHLSLEEYGNTDVEIAVLDISFLYVMHMLKDDYERKAEYLP